MRRILRTAAILALCLSALFWALPAIAAQDADWRALYTNFLTSQQSQLRARRSVALIDLGGDGVPELVQLYSTRGESRTCRLGVYTIRSGSVVPMSAGDGFNFSTTFPGVRSTSFQLRADPSLKPCLSISISGASGGAATTTRLAFTLSGSAAKLDVALYEARQVKGRKSLYSVSGVSATSAQYSDAYARFLAAYVKKGDSLPYQTFSSTAKGSTLKSGVTRLASRYRVHSTAAKVSLNKTSLTLAYGASYALKASISPASAIYDSCTWTSSVPGVVKVDGGLVTALDIGTATITVRTASGAHKSCFVTVLPPPASSVKVSGDAHTVLLGKTTTLSATVAPEKASQAVKWSSANSSVVSVKDGVVTGRKMGTTTIRATTSNGKSCTYTITVLAEELNKDGAIIDISRWNAVANWSVLSKNVAFVILRCGVTYSADSDKAGQMDIDVCFDAYAQQCLRYGIPFGVYYYGLAATPEQARQEADKAYLVAQKYHPLFYAYDAEKPVLTGDSIEAFGGRLRELGVNKVGCYIAHQLYSRYKVDTSKFDFIWIPHYGANTGEVLSTPSYKCDLHQYSSRGKVAGMADTTVDVNRLMGRKPLSFFTS